MSQVKFLKSIFQLKLLQHIKSNHYTWKSNQVKKVSLYLHNIDAKPEQHFQRGQESGSTAYLTTWKFWSSKKNVESWEWGCLLRCNKSKKCKSSHYNSGADLIYRLDFLFKTIVQLIAYQYKIKNTVNRIFDNSTFKIFLSCVILQSKTKNIE